MSEADEQPGKRLSWQVVARWLLRRHRFIERLGIATVDLPLRIALLPFRRQRTAGVAREDGSLVARTSEFNDAAEAYFAAFPSPDFLLNKPFSEPDSFARHLITVGILVENLQIRPGATVLELGAGSCWLSHMLNRYGCRTIAVDVSPTALTLGRRLFESDTRTRWELEPTFLSYDGRTLPVETASCDHIVVNDAFHHIPNQRALLSEMHRVLAIDGTVGMSEPGEGHGGAAQSLLETASTGVLENELYLPDLQALALACGFERVTAVIASPVMRHQVSVSDLPAFMGGSGVASYWKELCGSLDRHHYLVFHKTAPRLSTKSPGRLVATLSSGTVEAVTIAKGTSSRISIQVTNKGDTLWLSAPGVAGWTRLGAHLYRSDGALIDYDWLRLDLPRPIGAGETISLEVPITADVAVGSYVIVFDFVVEGVSWFSERGSAPLSLPLVVN